MDPPHAAGHDAMKVTGRIENKTASATFLFYFEMPDCFIAIGLVDV